MIQREFHPRYFDSKKVRAATVKINKVVSLIKTETITETYSLIRAVRNILADGGLQKQGDDRKQTTKLTKKNFTEAESITERVKTITQIETKGTAK